MSGLAAIALTAALVSPQTPPEPPALRPLSVCAAIRQSEALRDRPVMLTEMGARGCRILSSDWRPDGDLMARTVRDGLAARTPAFTVGEWRKRQVGEYGPTMWTTFEQKDAEGEVIGALTLIEPMDGRTGEMSLTYQAIQP